MGGSMVFRYPYAEKDDAASEKRNRPDFFMQG